MTVRNGPDIVVWDITYACPLRCVHCYTESGRRPARQLGHADAVRVADAIGSMRPSWLFLAGGEPLVVPYVFDVADRVRRGGVPVSAYTSGWTMSPALARRVAGGLDGVSVSIDGATAAVHDRIRGRAGSFARAWEAVRLLDAEAERMAGAGDPPLPLSIDFTVTRSGFDEIERFCGALLTGLRNLTAVHFSAAIPSGLASREGFADHELLTDEQAHELGTAGLRERLQALAPPGVEITTTNDLILRTYAWSEGDTRTVDHMQVEADGAVRGIPIYEGTVGNLLTEPAAELWQRAVRRRRDPFVTRALSSVRTMTEWAAAARRIDRHFASDTDRARIDRRPEYQPVGTPR